MSGTKFLYIIIVSRDHSLCVNAFVKLIDMFMYSIGGLGLGVVGLKDDTDLICLIINTDLICNRTCFLQDKTSKVTKN